MAVELATAYVRVRANLDGLQAQISAGVRAAVTGAQAQVASTGAVAGTAAQADQLDLLAAGYKEVASSAVSAGAATKDAAATSAETIAATAQANVAATVKEIDANLALSASYGEIAAAAEKGSATAAAAAKLSADATASAAAKLGVATEAGAATAGASLDGLRTKVFSLSKVLGVGIGAAFAVKFAKDVVGSAANLQKSQEVIQEEFGKSGDALTAFGEKGAQALGISAQTADATSARFGILFKNLDIAPSLAARMTQGFESLAGSLSAIKGVDPSQVLQSIVLAAAGNTRGLKQLGISVDTTSEKIAAFKLGLTDSITQALNPAQKAEAIYALATENLGQFQQQAAAHAHDYANEQRQLSAAFSNAKDVIGAALLPALSSLTSELGAWLTKMTQSGKLQRDVNSALSDAKQIIGGVKDVLSTVLPPLQAVISAVGGLGNAVKIMAAVWFGWKIGTIIGNLSLLVEGLFSTTAAVETNAAAVVAANEAIAASAVEAGGAEGVGLLAGGIAALTGPVGLAVVGIAGLTAGIVYLATRESDATAANRNFVSSITDLNTALAATPQDKLSLAQANLAVQQAKANSELSAGKKGTLAYKQAVLDLDAALQQQKAARAQYQSDLTKISTGQTAAKKTAQDLVAALKTQATNANVPIGGTRAGVGATPGQSASNFAAARQKAALDFAQGIQADAAAQKNLTPTIRQNLDLLSQFTLTVGRIPTQKEINFILDNRSATTSLSDIVTRLNELPQYATNAGTATGDNFTQSLTAAVAEGKGLGNGVAALFNALPDPLSAASAQTAGQRFATLFLDPINAAIQGAQDQIQAALKSGIAAATTASNTNAQAISEAQQRIGLLNEKLGQTIQQNAIDLTNSINQAKQNLASIGQSLASSVGSVLDQPLTNLQNKLTLAQNKLSLDQLRRSALLPGGKQLSTDPNKAVAELQSLAAKASTATKPYIESFLQQYQQASLSVAQDQVNQRKITATRTINDITDGINTGRLSVTKGRDQLLSLLKRDGVSYKTAGKLLGTSFADGFNAQLKGIQDQAKALNGFTGGATGSGQEATIVQPALLVAQQQRDVAQQQLTIAKANTALQKKIATNTKTIADTLAAEKAVKVNPNALGRNPGRQKKTSTNLTGATR